MNMFKMGREITSGPRKEAASPQFLLDIGGKGLFNSDREQHRGGMTMTRVELGKTGIVIEKNGFGCLPSVFPGKRRSGC